MVMIFSATKAMYALFAADIGGTGPIFNNVTQGARYPCGPHDLVPCDHVDGKSVPSRGRGDKHKSPIRESGVLLHRDNLRRHHVDEVHIAGGVFHPMTTLTVCFIGAVSQHFSCGVYLNL